MKITKKERKSRLSQRIINGKRFIESEQAKGEKANKELIELYKVKVAEAEEEYKKLA